MSQVAIGKPQPALTLYQLQGEPAVAKFTDMQGASFAHKVDLGKTSAGGTETSATTDRLYAFVKFTLTEQVRFKTCRIYGRNNAATTIRRFQAAVYVDNAGYPGAKASEVSGEGYFNSATAAWVTLTWTNIQTLNPGTYWLCLSVDNDTSYYNIFYYDAAAANSSYILVQTYTAGSMPDPFPAGATAYAREMSGYLQAWYTGRKEIYSKTIAPTNATMLKNSYWGHLSLAVTTVFYLVVDSVDEASRSKATTGSEKLFTLKKALAAGSHTIKVEAAVTGTEADAYTQSSYLDSPSYGVCARLLTDATSETVIFTDPLQSLLWYAQLRFEGATGDTATAYFQTLIGGGGKKLSLSLVVNDVRALGAESALTQVSAQVSDSYDCAYITALEKFVPDVYDPSEPIPLISAYDPQTISPTGAGSIDASTRQYAKFAVNYGYLRLCAFEATGLNADLRLGGTGYASILACASGGKNMKTEKDWGSPIFFYDALLYVCYDLAGTLRYTLLLAYPTITQVVAI